MGAPAELLQAVMARSGRREGDEIRFCCPAHEDENPSARYNERKETWYCDVCKLGDGWKNLSKRLGIPVSRQTSSKRDIVAEYTYEDAEGNPLFQVVRFEPKDFRQRRPDGKGKWVWNLEGVERVLYHLPEVLAAIAAEKPIWLVEGEKDADRLTSLGLVATTASGGAGKWLASYTETLKGADVVLVPDLDKPGKDHAHTVLRSVSKVARSISLVMPPKEHAKDISDWADLRRSEGRSEEEFRAELEQLAEENTKNLANEDFASDAEAIAAILAAVKPTQAEILIRLAFEGGATFFHSPDHTAYVTIDQDERQQNFPVRSEFFRLWLLQRYYQEFRKVPKAQSLTDALGVLQGNAFFEGECHEVHYRLAGVGEDRIYLDLGDDTWQAVEITPSGWQIVSTVPVKFLRTSSTCALPHPARGGSLRELGELLNLPDETSQVLYSAFLVASLRPTGPFPALVLQGEQGSAKSTAARFAKSLIDPTDAPLRSAPGDERDLMIAASHSWMPAYDNLSGLPHWLSDALCRLATGGGFATRRLYTDSDEQIFNAMRPVILNGIDDVAVRQDFADRCLTLHLPPIREERRRTEKELKRRFDAARPRLLGCLLDAVCHALRTVASIQLDSLPRMADFAVWCVAAEEAFPWEPGTFLEAYEGNRKDTIEQTLEADSVALVIRDLLDAKGHFQGTAGELLATLSERADDRLSASRGWPKSPQAMSSRLDRAAPFLRSSGYHVERWRESTTRRRRMIRLENRESSSKSSMSSGSSAGRPESTESKDYASSFVSDDPDANGRSRTRLYGRNQYGRKSTKPEEMPSELRAERVRVVVEEATAPRAYRVSSVVKHQPGVEKEGTTTLLLEEVPAFEDGPDHLAAATEDDADEDRTREASEVTVRSAESSDASDDMDEEPASSSKSRASQDVEAFEL